MNAGCTADLQDGCSSGSRHVLLVDDVPQAVIGIALHGVDDLSPEEPLDQPRDAFPERTRRWLGLLGIDRGPLAGLVDRVPVLVVRQFTRSGCSHAGRLVPLPGRRGGHALSQVAPWRPVMNRTNPTAVAQLKRQTT